MWILLIGKSVFFCQKVKPKERVSNVVTFKMSEKILEVSHLDNVIIIRLAGVNDPIAAGAKYPLKCLSAFFKSTARAKKSFKDSDLALIFVQAKDRYLNLIQFGTVMLISQMRLKLSFHRAF